MAKQSKFAKCVKSVKKSGSADDPRAVCAAIGRRKYGQAEMTRRSIAGKKRAKRKNPADASADVYEQFHGRPSDEVVVVSKKVHFHAHLAGLGTLTLLEVKGPDGNVHRNTKFGGALLCCNEEMNQLFIEGGKQFVDVAEFGIKTPHEKEVLGKLLEIGYHTTKDHLDPHEGGTANYIHRFRSTNRDGKHVTIKMAKCPTLIYDARNEQLEIAGGSYTIRPEGIDL